MPTRNTSMYVLAFVLFGTRAAWQLLFGDSDLGMAEAFIAVFALRCAYMARTLNTLREVRRG